MKDKLFSDLYNHHIKYSCFMDQEDLKCLSVLDNEEVMKTCAEMFMKKMGSTPSCVLDCYL